MANQHHGISGREVQSGIIPMQDATTNTIGMICFADDADPIVFPENVPVRVSSINRVLPAAGLTGNLRKNLEIISKITNPTLIVIRIPSPFGEVFDVHNVTGGVNEFGQRTGIEAFLTAKSILGISPKIIIAPDLETPDVVEALAAVCKKLRAYSYVTPRDATGGILTTAEEVVLYRDQLAHREIELIWPEWTSGSVFLGEIQPPQH